jgi:hypothetical protein
MTIKLTAFLVVVTILISGCSKSQSDHASSSSSAETEFDTIGKLPHNINVNQVKTAFEEYANYRLWYYPDEHNTHIDLQSHIGKEINADMLVFESNPDHIYLRTEASESLGIIVYKDGFVYLDGFVEPENPNRLYPQGKHAKVATIKVKINEPHKPNYGTSPRKDNMIQAAERYAETLCKDFLSGEESALWENADNYILDFYEYQDIIGIWWIRKDGYASTTPVQIIENNHAFQSHGIKGYSIADFTKHDELYTSEQRFIADAVKRMACRP